MIILITGGTGSFGGHIVSQLRGQGHLVYTVGANNEDSVVMEFSSMYNEPFPAGGVERAFRTVEHMAKAPIDCLINHVGVTHIDWLEQHSFKDFERVFRINLFTPFLFTRQWVRRIAKAPMVPLEVDYEETRQYILVNTCSMAARIGFRACSSYPASKAALVMMTKGWAKEFAGRLPISVFGISPGSVEDSGMTDYAVNSLMRTRGMSGEQAKAYNSQSPLGRYATHEEVWQMYDFAINRAPEFASGSIFEMANATGL